MSAWASGNLAEKLKGMKRVPAPAAPAPAKEETTAAAAPAAPVAASPAEAPATPAQAPAKAAASEKKAAATPVQKETKPAAPVVKYVSLGPVSFSEGLAAFASEEFTFIGALPQEPKVVQQPPQRQQPQPRVAPAPLNPASPVPVAADAAPVVSSSAAAGYPQMPQSSPYQRHQAPQHQVRHSTYQSNPPASYFVPQQQQPRYQNPNVNGAYGNAEFGGDVQGHYNMQYPQQSYYPQQRMYPQQQQQQGGNYYYGGYNPYYGGGAYRNDGFIPTRLQSRPPYYPPQEPAK